VQEVHTFGILSTRAIKMVRDVDYSKRILIIVPEEAVNTNPNLVAIINLLYEKGYLIDIIASCKPDISDYFEIQQATVYLIRDYNLFRNFILSNEKLEEVNRHVSGFIKKSLAEYTLIIGIDRGGIIDAHFLSSLSGVPYALISYEIFFESETSYDFKKPEIVASKQVEFAICQDSVRAQKLSEENHIPIKKIINVPVCSRGAKKPFRSRYLYETLGISEDKKIVLFVGSIGRVNGIDEILVNLKDWPDDWVLVLHDRYGHFKHSEYKKYYKSHKNLFLSAVPFNTLDQMSEMFFSATLGIALYFPTYHSPYHGKNLEYLGWSSGKINAYLQHGLPVLVNEIGLTSNAVISHQLGYVIRDGERISDLLKKVTDDDIKKYRINCLHYFAANLDVDNFRDTILSAMEQAAQNRKIASMPGRIEGGAALADLVKYVITSEIRLAQVHGSLEYRIGHYCLHPSKIPRNILRIILHVTKSTWVFFRSKI
jgi:glycosyltransferase involved in cell wall biosynthesis